MAHGTLRDRARAMAQLRAIWHCEIFDTTPARSHCHLIYWLRYYRQTRHMTRLPGPRIIDPLYTQRSVITAPSYA